MRKTLLILTTFFSFTMANAQTVGDTEVLNNITYTVTNDSPFEVEVSGFSDLDAASASITIPPSVTVSSTSCSVVAVADGAFSCNSSKGDGDSRNNALTTVVLPSTVLTVGAHSFRDNPNLLSINLNYLTSTGSNVFANCTNLETIGTLSNMVSLGDYTFSKCLGLDSTIELPVVETIGNGAISATDGTYKAGGITYINIPSTVTSIGTIFLGRLWDLTEVQVNWATPLENVSATNFFRSLDLSTITLYVPAGTKTTYENHAVWGLFPDENIIEGTLGTENTQSIQTKIYPNPTADIVTVQTETATEFSLSLYNLNGQQLLSAIGNQIDLSSLDSGIYILKGTSDKGQFNQRVIKK